MSSAYIYSQILIVNTRTGGQNPNVLCAVQTPTGFVPQLSVYNTGKLPPNCKWNIGYASAGAQFTIEMNDTSNNNYRLAVPLTNTTNGTKCSLVLSTALGYCTSWAFPYSTRIISGLGTGLHPYDGNQGALSLDAGGYPAPIVWQFVSNVNQTWEFGYSMDALKPLPF
ncbi:hypothetical protein ACWCW7_21905 [Nocardia tengchongensis]